MVQQISRSHYHHDHQAITVNSSKHFTISWHAQHCSHGMNHDTTDELILTLACVGVLADTKSLSVVHELHSVTNLYMYYVNR